MSHNHAVTDNHVIIATGSKKAMLKQRATLAAADMAGRPGHVFDDHRYQVYLNMGHDIGYNFNQEYV